MEINETQAVLAALQTAYPNAYKNLSQTDAAIMAGMWQSAFANDDGTQVLAAVKAMIYTRKEGYAPTIGAVKEMLYMLRRGDDEPDEIEAWRLVSRAVRNGLYGSQKEFDKLPPIVQQAVRDPGQLRAWAMLPEDELHTVVASNFAKTYRIMEQRRRMDSMLPSEIRECFQPERERRRLEENAKARERLEWAKQFLDGEVGVE